MESSSGHLAVQPIDNFPSRPRLLVRGITRRCAWCGDRKAYFIGWFKRQERCHACGHAYRRGDEAFELGAITANIILTFLSLLGTVLVLVVLTAPDVPVLGVMLAAGAVGLFGWIQLVLLGNSLPLIDTGELFPSREFSRRFGQLSNINQNWTPDPSEALVMVGVFGIVSMLMMWWMTLLITPNYECQMRGWRRARKVNRSWLVPTSDAATGLPWVILMVAMAAFGWWTFARVLLESRWFIGYEPTSVALIAMTAVFITGGLGFHALLEGKGKRAAGMATIFGGVVPIFVGTVMAVSSDRLAAASVWLMGICPLSWPIYGSVVAVPNDEIPREIVKALPNAFWFWQGVALLTVLWLLAELWKTRRAIANHTLERSDLE